MIAVLRAFEEKVAAFRPFRVSDVTPGKQSVPRYSQPQPAVQSTRPDLVVPQKNIEPPAVEHV